MNQTEKNKPIERIKTVALDENDPRLAAADLSEREFIGTLHEHPDNDAFGLLEAMNNPQHWQSLPAMELIQLRDGYSLHCEPGAGGQITAFLLFENNLVGIFVNDTVVVDYGHRGQHLSRELILAGFAQTPWKNPERLVTTAGKKALQSAYKFIREAADK